MREELDPFIINWKGKIPNGKIIEKITGVIDLFPTLKDITGIRVKPKKPFDGISLKPLIFIDNPELGGPFNIQLLEREV